ncbi:uncharacterized protein A4U43_C09F4960 [Asparagus officinalis]|uniref:Uncharacterized protein n=1 Tax=Asparagus officinalis TaxID=4686 RepID=A0A5P1E5E4_ASPOF|nr:uncharacterized protein LOC109824697 [Asparagus officinalis]ONK57861.1 uncharacterized protein A4U43_C09F4960 [Asparagus officinalis]
MLIMKTGLKFDRVVLFLCILVVIFRFGLREVDAHKTHRYRRTNLQVGTDRILVEAQNDTISALTIRTQRVDPLNDLKKYRGGYNITNKHYWSSTIFTGKFGYIIAALWLIAGLIYAIILLVTSLCCNKRRKRKENKKLLCSRKYNLWPVLLAIILTLLAIVASGVALSGSVGFNSRAKIIKNIILDAANNASGTIYSVTDAVKAMQNDSQIYRRLDRSGRLNSTLQRLDGDADRIERKAGKTMHYLNKGLKILNVVTIVTVSVNLVAVIGLLVSGPFLRLRRIFHMLIIICWVLIILFWVYFGLYYFLNKFAGDTCAALDEFRQDPRNSTLSSILPCNDQTSAKTALHDVGAGIHNIVDQVNANIPSLQSLSQQGVEYICNPFSGPPDYNYQPENCSSNTIQIGNIPQLLKAYSCSNETCKQGEFISAGNYNKAVVYTSSIQEIVDAYPGMESLVDCKLVKDAFSKILFEECKPLKKHVHIAWAAFVALSTIMVIMVLLWIVEDRRESKCCSVDGSVKPHSSPRQSSEVDVNEMAYRDTEFRQEA